MSTVGIPLQEQKEIKQKTAKALLWVGMAGMSMLFAGLMSAYVVRQAQGGWLYFELPSLFTYSTLIILASSATMVWAVQSAKRNNTTWLPVSVSLLLGGVFVWFQFQSWEYLVNQEIFFTGGKSSASGSFLFVLTGVHMAHLAGGIITLLVTLYQSVKNKYKDGNIMGLELASMYWHFLTVLWVILFAFLHFIR